MNLGVDALGTRRARGPVLLEAARLLGGNLLVEEGKEVVDNLVAAAILESIREFFDQSIVIHASHFFSLTL